MASPKSNLRTFEPSNLRTFEPSNGFTLIEVLVATAVMAIIVLMLGGVFNQASSSWDSGYVRADGGMAVRAVIGSLTRDLATAVDGRRYGLGEPIEGGGGSLHFYRLLGDGSGTVEEVKYSGGASVKRNDDTIYDASQQTASRATFQFYVAGVTEQTQDSAEYRKYEDEDFREEIVWTVPYVKVRCTLTRTGSLSGITVRSMGKDGKQSDDDIVVQ